MFEWLADPIWSGIGVLAPLAAWGLRKGYCAWKQRNPAISDAEDLVSPPQTSEAYALVNRFVSIYKAHGIERVQIPRLLGEEAGLTIAHMGDDERLLQALSEKILNDTCNRFGLSRNWLDGKPCPIYPGRWYDKNLKGYVDFLGNIQSQHERVDGFLIKCANQQLIKDASDSPVVFVFRGQLEHWGEVGDDSIWKYYPLNDTLFWGYRRTRIQIKAMVLAAWQLGIHIHGCELPTKSVERLIEGATFPGPLIENTHWVAWHPDAYIFAEGESCLVEDGKEALEVRDEMERLGWMNYLLEKTGPLRIPLAGKE